MPPVPGGQANVSWAGEAPLVRHQNRYRHVIEQITADAADQSFAQLRVVIKAGDNQVGTEIGGAGEQDIRYRDPALHAFFEPGRNRMPLQVTDDPLERCSPPLEFRLARADGYHCYGLGFAE